MDILVVEEYAGELFRRGCYVEGRGTRDDGADCGVEVLGRVC